MYTDTVQIQVQVNRRDISYISAIFEMYENLAIMRTIDRDRDSEKSIVEFMIAPDFLEDSRKLLHALCKEVPLQILKDPA
jgi:hypothetical protein